MPFATFDPPAGVFRNGTQYEAKGRWYDSSLVRWHDGVLMPVGGWVPVQDSTPADIDLDGPVLGMFAWRGNDGVARVLIGTHDEMWEFHEGTLTDITPASGFVAGGTSATIASVYGAGNYGAGNYGGGGTTQGTIVEAQSWQMDNFGQLPVAMAYSDGKIYSWDLNTSNNLAVVSNAPTDNRGIVVTPERFLVALGESDDPRSVAWADQESLTLWTPASTNQAGDFPLSTEGEILTGRRGNGETLIWTTVDLWAMRYIGGTLVYRIDRKASSCGAISRRAMGAAAGRYYWMGHRSFFMYDGAVREIPSEVSDYVFSDLNRTQASKIHAVPRARFREIEWFYCSAGSSEIDRSVTYNYLADHWRVETQCPRSAGVDEGVFQYPMLGDRNGKVYEHERGTSYLALDGTTPQTPYAETGPFELGEGDLRHMVRQVIPDENTLGGVSAVIYAKDYPTSAERDTGTITLANPTSVRISGRTTRLRVQQVTPDWRVGRVRLEVTPTSGR